jgi:N-glycosylase/DNA lyase
MQVASVPFPRLEKAIREVCICLQEKRDSKFGWETLGEDDLWRELVACILGSRVRYEVAYSAIERMEKANLFSATRTLTKRPNYEKDILSALSGPNGSTDGCGIPKRYPFPRLRAGQISSAAETLYSSGGTIRSLLEKAPDEREARRHLARDVAGLGPKQASLFLRNIGYAEQVAVLDVHVLTYMGWAGLTTSPVRAVRTIRQYEILEDAFIEHSRSSGFPPDRFDLAVWVVVRVVKKEYSSCQ